MVYWHILMGIGCVVIAAATAVYFSRSDPEPPHQTHRGRRRKDDDDADNGVKGDTHDNNGFRASRPGDKCILCHNVMTKETMHTMHCGHALDDTPCFQEWRKHRRQCPHCDQLVLRIHLPGDDCAICCESMEESTMQYLKCEHALHSNCLQKYKANKYTKCPVCARQL